MKKYANIKFHGNPSSGSRVFPCGRIDGRTYMAKLILTFHIFANGSKKAQMLFRLFVHKIARWPVRVCKLRGAGSECAGGGECCEASEQHCQVAQLSVGVRAAGLRIFTHTR